MFGLAGLLYDMSFTLIPVGSLSVGYAMISLVIDPVGTLSGEYGLSRYGSPPDDEYSGTSSSHAI